MRVPRVLSVLALMCVSAAASAQAHPLGNFTINHLGEFSVALDRLNVRYVLDIAEIPTFQIMQSRPGKWNAETLQQWANDEVALVRSGLDVRIDGTPAQLQSAGARADARPGAGGLPILRWVGEFHVALRPGAHAVAVADGVYADRRIGWKDLIAGKQSEPTNELRSYPSALIGTPRRVAAIRFSTTGTAISGIVRSTDPQPIIASAGGWLRPTMLSDMFARPSQTPLFVLLTILAAFGLGALHAVEPGHGKALLAFTLVGARATSKQALTLATSLTLAHTIGVFLLGAALFFAGGFVSESVYPWITLVSGVAIAVIGARALARFVHERRGHAHSHEHAHDGARPHAHGHDHVRAHDRSDGHGHTHVIPGSQRLNFGSAVWAAMSGGIAPCPAAIVVLLAALRLHHLPYGMLLIVIFSMGLASVLSAIGLGVVRGASWLSQRSFYARFAAIGPVLTGSAISIIGSIMLGQGLHDEGARAPAALIAALVLTAIAGFVLSQNAHHHHRSHLNAEGAV